MAPRGGSIRLDLIDPPAGHTTLDGACWPRTRDLVQELPALVEELHRRGIRVTRVAYNPDPWEPAPRRLDADGRTIRLGWFRHLDRQLLDMTGDLSRGRLDFLVVPPEATAATAAHASSAATDRANRQAPTELLDTLGADPLTDRFVLDRGDQLTFLVPVAGAAQAPAVAVDLVAEGVQLIELCGGFPLAAAARVSEAVQGRVPVGHVTFAVDSIPGAGAYSAAFDDRAERPAAIHEVTATTGDTGQGVV